MRFFVDEDLDSPSFVSPLQAAGLTVVRHREQFQKGAPDTVWIPSVTEQGLIILTKNTKMLFTPIEVQAIRVTAARVLFLHGSKVSRHPDLGALLVRSQPRIAKFFETDVLPRVGVLKRQPHSRDPNGAMSGYIEVPAAFR